MARNIAGASQLHLTAPGLDVLLPLELVELPALLVISEHGLVGNQ
jgi:hypothetical protein